LLFQLLYICVLVHIILIGQRYEFTKVYFNYSKLIERLQAIGSGHLQEALDNFERAKQINPGFPAIAGLNNFVNEVGQQIEAARNSMDAAVEQGKYGKALSLARAIDRYMESVKNLANDNGK